MPAEPVPSRQHPPTNSPDITGAYKSRDPAAAETVEKLLAGKYKLLQEIGEGGMGRVFMANQTQPVKRRVAVKVVKAGMDSVRILARFEAERQALALMDHPHIARVLDAGTTDSGKPFFVMELVKGVPLTDYCVEHKLPVLDRLTLFIQICSAMQHAHQKGVSHRDLKSTNILVENHDDKAVPKVIDFGLAKATSGMQLTEHTVFTAIGTVAGKPLYMASEQAAINPVDVDTGADVDALGVILYELLTGTTPIERGRFKQAAFDEMLRVIREVEPPTPSSRLSQSETKLPNRRSDCDRGGGDGANRSRTLRDAPSDQLVIGWRVGFLPRCLKMSTRFGEVAGATIEFAHRRIEQVILADFIEMSSRSDGLNSGLRPFDLGNDDRSIQFINR